MSSAEHISKDDESEIVNLMAMDEQFRTWKIPSGSILEDNFGNCTAISFARCRIACNHTMLKEVYFAKSEETNYAYEIDENFDA